MIDYFIYINLDEKKERKNHMESLLSKFNLPYERLKGIKPKKDDIDLYKIAEHIRPWKNPRQLPRLLGVLGCYKSHLECLKKIRNLSFNYVGILEDDVYFNDSSLNYINNLIESLNRKNIEWDILRVIWSYEKKKCMEPLTKEIIVDNEKIYKFNSTNFQSKFCGENINQINGGTHFQIINVKNINKILNFLEKEYIFDIDGIYSTNQLKVIITFSKNIISNYLRDKSSIPKIRFLKK